jgi:hypothetical protein
MSGIEWWRIGMYVTGAGAVIAMYFSGAAILLDVCVIGGLAVLFTVQELRR